jgi:hypothetical protein
LTGCYVGGEFLAACDYKLADRFAKGLEAARLVRNSWLTFLMLGKLAHLANGDPNLIQLLDAPILVASVLE